MGFLNRFFRCLFGSPPSVAGPPDASGTTNLAETSSTTTSPRCGSPLRRASHDVDVVIGAPTSAPRKKYRLSPLRYKVDQPGHLDEPLSSEPPYAFANLAIDSGKFLDLSRDTDPQRLASFSLPMLSTPDDLATWLGIPVGKLAWLTNRFSENRRPQSKKEAHYHFHWVRKRKGGYRLIEAPKSTLKQVQTRILEEILNRIPTHEAAHGFVTGRSAVTNARPHVRRRVVVKLDLENFYPSVRFSRVVAIFRSVGYNREIALWLARLTTSAVPTGLETPEGGASALWAYIPRHLPQGAPTSPALANLSAYALDVRLSGLAAKYRLAYTRYADDLTVSGSGKIIPALSELLPHITHIIRSERFRINRAKRKVLRNNQRQVITGVIVNRHINIQRSEFDQLKAIVNNCIRQGPASQNRSGHQDFAAHLRGRIAHVLQLNRAKGQRLLKAYLLIDWSR